MTPWTPELDAEVARLRAKGMSLPQVAVRLGRSHSSVKHRLARLRDAVAHGGEVEAKGWRWTEADDATLREMRAAGATAGEIAAALGRTKAAVGFRCKTFGIVACVKPAGERRAVPRKPLPRPVRLVDLTAAPAAPEAPAAAPEPPPPVLAPEPLTGPGLGFGEALAAPTASLMRRALAEHLDALGAGAADLALLERAVSVGGLSEAEVARVKAVCRPIRERVWVPGRGVARHHQRIQNNTAGQALLVSLLRARIAMEAA